MNKMKLPVLKYWSEEDGATSIEYALLAAGIAIAIISTVATMGGTLLEVYSDVGTKVIEARGLGE
jgi:pilus assembly protein Flp/PilA